LKYKKLASFTSKRSVKGEFPTGNRSFACICEYTLQCLVSSQLVFAKEPQEIKFYNSYWLLLWTFIQLQKRHGNMRRLLTTCGAGLEAEPVS
jgi:hypothetical protein